MSDLSRMKAVLVVAGTVAFVLSPVLSDSFGGFDPAQFPVPQDDPPAQPAGWAFAIWSVIYGWLMVHAGYGLLRRAEDPAWDRMRLPLIASLTLGAAWIPIALRSPLWASVVIWLMLLTALWALFLAPKADRWLARVPLALYAGWLTAASWVSIALIGAGWGVGPDALGWAWIVLLGALIFAAGVLLRLRPIPEYAAPIAWALVGIAAANAATHMALAGAAVAGGFAVLALSVTKRG